MFKVELGSDDFYKDSEYVKIGNVAKAIARILLSNDSPNRFQSERDAWPLIHTGIAENKLHPLAPETLDVLSIDNYGNGIVAFSELAEWGVWCHRFNFVKKCAQSASGAKAGEMKALKAKNKARLERAITPQGSVSYAPRVDLPTPLEQPDWDYWPYLPTVEPWQACAIALNINPKVRSPEEDLYHGQNFKLWFNRMNADCHKKYHSLAKLLMANLPDKQHFPTSTATGVCLPEFAAWCIHIRRDIPPELAALAKNSTQAAPAAKGDAGAALTMDMSGIVYWRTVLYDNIRQFDEATSKGKADVRQIIKNMKNLGDERILNKGSFDKLIWLDDMGNELTVAKQTVSNAISEARKLPI